MPAGGRGRGAADCRREGREGREDRRIAHVTSYLRYPTQDVKPPCAWVQSPDHARAARDRSPSPEPCPSVTWGHDRVGPGDACFAARTRPAPPPCAPQRTPPRGPPPS